MILNRLMLRSRKGQSEWLSWVLLFAFVVGLGIFIYFWMVSRTQASVNQMNTIVADSADCDSVSIYVFSSCQDIQKISFNITNSNTLQIDALVFRTYDLSASPEVQTRNITIRPGSTREVIAFKQGIT